MHSSFARDDASIKQILERIVHRAHALASTRLDDAVDLRGLAFADEIANGAVHQHDLHGLNATLDVAALHKRNGEDGLERIGEHHAHLRLLGLGKDRNDAVNGLSRSTGMQRGKNQMTGFGCLQGKTDRFAVAHFAHHHNVRVLAKCNAKSGLETGRMKAYFALAHHAAEAFITKFNRVLNREAWKAQ